jgi:hypothetical protein
MHIVLIAVALVAAATVTTASDVELDFRISAYSDAAGCTGTPEWTELHAANECTQTHADGSSQWNCPGVATPPEHPIFQYVSYNSMADCRNAPDAPSGNHVNFCGECKENTLRKCDLEARTVTFYNCSDYLCGMEGCSKLGTVSFDAGNCIALPGGLGYPAVRMSKVEPVFSHPLSMYHQWWTASPSCASKNATHGWDYIPLGYCNSGWKFECIPRTNATSSKVVAGKTGGKKKVRALAEN